MYFIQFLNFIQLKLKIFMYFIQFLSFLSFTRNGHVSIQFVNFFETREDSTR